MLISHIKSIYTMYRHEFVNFMGRYFKVCEAFGGWGMNDASDSSYYDHGWEDLPTLLGE